MTGSASSFNLTLTSEIRPYGESVFKYFFTFINYLREPLKLMDDTASTLKKVLKKCSVAQNEALKV